MSKTSRENYQCPACKSTNCWVRDSRLAGDSRRRRRECKDCLARFTTYEVVESDGVRPLHHWERERKLLRLLRQATALNEEIRQLAHEILGEDYDVGPDAAADRGAGDSALRFTGLAGSP